MKRTVSVSTRGNAPGYRLESVTKSGKFIFELDARRRLEAACKIKPDGTRFDFKGALQKARKALEKGLAKAIEKHLFATLDLSEEITGQQKALKLLEEDVLVLERILETRRREREHVARLIGELMRKRGRLGQ